MTLQRRPALAPPTHAPTIAPAGLDPAAFTTSVVQWYLEFRAGRRSLGQLHGVITPTLQRRLARRAADRRPAPPLRPVVRTLVQRRDAHTWSAVALVRHRPDDQAPEGRVTAITLQVRHDGTRWWLTELTAPEDGDPPVGDIGRRLPGEPEDAWEDLL